MKTKLLILIISGFVFGFQAVAQPANDLIGGAIPINPSAEGTGCASPTFTLPFSTDGTTDSGVQGACSNSGLDQFFTWAATTTGLNFSSQAPGNPGIVVWDVTGTVEITCTNTFGNDIIYGWDLGDDLIIQIYDFGGTTLSDVAFCLEVNDYAAPSPPPVTFTSQSSGATGSYKIAVVDMNGDFLDDLVSISSTNVNIREQNSGGGFTTRNITTTAANFLPSWSLAAADYNKDGYTDLLYGAGSGVTFMRSNNTGTAFTEVSGSEYVFSQRSNFADINNDGHLDAFVCHDVDHNVYYINDGSGNLTFYQSEVTAGAPVNLGNYPSGGNYGSIWIDYDNDRDLDMFIAKCGGETARRTNQMYTNDGSENYTENALAIGLADPMQTWSSAWGDFDNDGDMDVFVGASSGTHKLMSNTNGVFTDVSASSGVNDLTATSIETVTFDFDNDGNLDLVSGNNVLFGNGDLTFTVYTSVFPSSGAYGDLNNDGYIDAFRSGSIYINNADTNNNWIKIHTTGTASNINGIGARVEIHTAAGVQIRDVRSGDGFEFMNSLNTHFGIGSETAINSIVIYWPSGIVDTVLNPTINTPIEVVEGSTLSLENSFVNDLVVYPNPTKSVLNLSTTDTLENAIYTVFDITGKRVMNAKLTSNAINVSHLSAGNYILRIISGSSIKSQKFIKQ